MRTASTTATGRFQPGQSGNPAGRPRGSTTHAAQLRRLENDALKLAVNTAEAIAEAAREALTEIEQPELIPLFDAITDAAKDAVKGGEIGPSSVAVLRGWYDSRMEYDDGGAFFIHAGLPTDCEWPTFKAHYTHRGRIDHSRHANDLSTFPPIVQRIKELRAERQLAPVNDKPSSKLEAGYD